LYDPYDSFVQAPAQEWKAAEQRTADRKARENIMASRQLEGKSTGDPRFSDLDMEILKCRQFFYGDILELSWDILHDGICLNMVLEPVKKKDG